MPLSDIALFDHEYDSARNSISLPKIVAFDTSPLPPRCVLSFMRDTLEDFARTHHLPHVADIHSETCELSVYLAQEDDTAVCLVHAPVGAPAAAIVADRLIDSGATHLVSCGGCGVTRPRDRGAILVPTHALRDEGTSFHYAAPSCEIALPPRAVEDIVAAAADMGIAASTCRTWTTDGLFRETPAIVERRREAGYDAVDMECSALAAVAQAYGAHYGCVLYSGDSLADPNVHDDRGWMSNTTAREAALLVALKAAARLR